MNLIGTKMILNAVNIAAGTTYYTNSFRIDYMANFCVMLKGTSAVGAPKFTVTIEQSDVAPTTEGSADTNYVTPASFPAICTDRILETYLIDSFAPVSLPYCRFVLTTDAASNGDSLFTIKLSYRENV